MIGREGKQLQQQVWKEVCNVIRPEIPDVAAKATSIEDFYQSLTNDNMRA